MLTNGKQDQTSADPEVFGQYPPGSWTVLGDTIPFVVLKITEEGGNRIVRRNRPYRDGAKLDDTGSKEKTFRVETIWTNGIEEDGNIPHLPWYPHTLNAMIDSADLHQTGDLVLPTRGSFRARLADYTREEEFGERDTARVTFVFVMDNEDNIDAASFLQPSIRATILRMNAELTFGAESLGATSTDLVDLETAAQDLQDAIAAPGEFVQDVDQKAARVVRLVDNVVRQFTVTGQFGRDQLRDPDSHATVRQMRLLQDRTARAAGEKKSSQPRIISRTFSRIISIFEVAALLGQDGPDLLALNHTLATPLAIPPNTPVRVFERS